MKNACPLFLEDDSIIHLDWIARQLSLQRNHTVTRSDAVEYLIRTHWKKMHKKQAKKKPIGLVA